MTSREFCYWLQGFFEIDGSSKPGLTENQVRIIKTHLELVFKHEIDNSYGTKEQVKELNDIHGGIMRC